MATKPVRKRLFVDARVQGALIGRLLLYWFACVVTVTSLVLCWRIVTGPARLFHTHFEEMWFHFAPGVIASLMLMPLVLFDLVRFSNRFTGPMFRMKREMHRLSVGEPVQELRFRDADFWHDFAAEFNAVAERMRQLEEVARRQSAEEMLTDA